MPGPLRALLGRLTGTLRDAGAGAAQPTTAPASERGTAAPSDARQRGPASSPPNTRDRTEQFRQWRGVADSMAVQMGVSRPEQPAPPRRPMEAFPLQRAAQALSRLRPELGQLLARKAEVVAALAEEELSESTRESLYALLSLLDEEIPQKLSDLKRLTLSVNKLPAHGPRETKLRSHVSASALEYLRRCTVEYRGSASRDAQPAPDMATSSQGLRRLMQLVHDALVVSSALYGAVWRVAKVAHEHPALAHARTGLALPAQEAKQGCARAVEGLLRASAALAAGSDEARQGVRAELAQLDRQAADAWSREAMAGPMDTLAVVVACHKALANELGRAVELAKSMRASPAPDESAAADAYLASCEALVRAARGAQQLSARLGDACKQALERRPSFAERAGLV